MFFVAEVSIPFNSVRDVLIKFPEWKLIMEQTNKYVFIDEPALRVSIHTIILLWSDVHHLLSFNRINFYWTRASDELQATPER